MTLTWVKKSLAAGPAGITTRQGLGSQHNIAIVQGAFDMQTVPGTRGQGRLGQNRALLDTHNLTIDSEEHGAPCNPFHLGTRLSDGQGHRYFVIGGRGGGHAMGARIHAGGCDFFDPNVGLIRCDSRVQFRALLIDYLPDAYEDLLDGEWGIFRVS